VAGQVGLSKADDWHERYNAAIGVGTHLFLFLLEVHMAFVDEIAEAKELNGWHIAESRKVVAHALK